LLAFYIRWAFGGQLAVRRSIESTISQIQGVFTLVRELLALRFHTASALQFSLMPLKFHVSALLLNFHLAKPPVVLLHDFLAAFRL
jgi:hypothetical protein